MSDDHKTPSRTGYVTTLWGIFPQLDQHLRRALLEAGYGDIMDENFEPPHDPLVHAKLFDGCEASVCWVRLEGRKEERNQELRELMMRMAADTLGEPPSGIDERVAEAEMTVLNEELRAINSYELRKIMLQMAVDSLHAPPSGTAERVAEAEMTGLNEEHRAGCSEELRRFLLQLLAGRFGKLPPEIEERVAQAEMSEIQGWARRLFDARSLEELFAPA
jgi:hypothetical protein